MIRRRVKILGGAAVALDLTERRIAGLDRRATQLQQRHEQPVERRPIRRFHFQAKVGRLAVGPPDTELIHLEAAVELDDLIEDALHQVRIDQVAFGLDNFLHCHGEYQFTTGDAPSSSADGSPTGARNLASYSCLVSSRVMVPTVMGILTCIWTGSLRESSLSHT